MGRILIDTRDIRETARDLRATNGMLAEVRSHVSAAIGGAWLGPNGGRFHEHWRHIVDSVQREGEAVHRGANDLEQYSASVDAEQARGAQRRAVVWAMRPLRIATTSFLGALRAVWRSIVEVFKRIAGWLREVFDLLARALARFAALVTDWILVAFRWASQASLAALRASRDFIGRHWRTAMKFLHGDYFSGRLGAIWSLLNEIPGVNLYTGAVKLASSLVALGIDEWNFISANNFNGREPTDAEKRDFERVKSDLGSVGDLGKVVQIGAGIAVLAIDTIKYSSANNWNGRPPNDEENRHGRELVEDVVGLVKIVPKKIKVGSEAVDAIFGTKTKPYTKPSKWLDGVFDNVFGKNSESVR